MNIKKREFPLKIHKLEALFRRLPEFHAKRSIIKAELDKSWAGHRGEEALDYHLASLQGSQPLMLHGLRILGKNGYFFQLDTLLLYPNMAVILETKNIAGTLFFDRSFHQLVRLQESGEDIFSDPLLQIQRQQRQLLAWLASYRITELPVIPLVVISFPTTKITADPTHTEAFQKVLHAVALPNKIEELHRRYPTDILTLTELEKMAYCLKAQHIPTILISSKNFKFPNPNC
ncbi:nuclease-related domain-containing protein [Bacillus sp. FJAT-27231]|uniref:nuclease-related domain-containing protein n=1 Tax=Bacillus sp. FJAT-27231 TaxID=1679168 RepID=UPI0006709D04|nr:nuclease-related domain-containing protein [Bacillus sp. FJAT-27231]